MLEQEGLNTWGVWEFSDWETFSGILKKGFEYAKQRCTAYPRFVVQRKLVDAVPRDVPAGASSGVRFGHPLAVEEGGDGVDDLPALDFGPLISAAKATELDESVDEALRHGAVPLYRGDKRGAGASCPARTPPPTTRRSRCSPLRGASRLMHEEPFGPVDSIIVVDTEAELLAQMNASNGALVASIASDDTEKARAAGRAGPGVQGRDQQAALARRQGRGVRRARRVVEGRVRGRRVPRPRRHRGPARGEHLRQLPGLPAHPAHLAHR